MTLFLSVSVSGLLSDPPFPPIYGAVPIPLFLCLLCTLPSTPPTPQSPSLSMTLFLSVSVSGLLSDPPFPLIYGAVPIPLFFCLVCMLTLKSQHKTLRSVRGPFSIKHLSSGSPFQNTLATHSLFVLKHQLTN